MKHGYAFLILGVLTSCYQGKKADLIIHNGTIYSCDSHFNVYEAMAIKDGKVLQLGPEREILNGYAADRLVDVEKRPVYPGFYNAHCDLYTFAQSLDETVLPPDCSFGELVQQLEEASRHSTSSWIKATQWTAPTREGNRPTNDTLNQLFPHRPVLVERAGARAALVNQSALEAVGFTANTSILGGDVDVRYGQCTGWVTGRAYDSLNTFISTWRRQHVLSAVQQAEKKLFETGVTAVTTVNVDSAKRDQLHSWYAAGHLTIKNSALLLPDRSNLTFAAREGNYKTAALQMRSFQLTLDNAPNEVGETQCEQREKYTGSVSEVHSVDAFRKIAEMAASVGYQVHAMSNSSAPYRPLLDCYVAVVGHLADHRWKVVIDGALSPDDLNTLVQCRAIPMVAMRRSMYKTPRKTDSDTPFSGSRSPLSKKVDRVVLIAPFSVAPIPPLQLFHAAISTGDEASQTALPQLGMSREQALKALTTWPAYANFENATRGSLEAGKDADFVVLTKDILVIPRADILTTFVERTIVDGVEVYRSE